MKKETSFTDNEIKKALECCYEASCSCMDCPYRNSDNCTTTLNNDIKDLINRYEAEVERLQGEAKEKTETIDFLKNQAVGWSIDFCNLKAQLKTAKSEARKEFAEIILSHLHQRIDECDNMTSEDPIWVNRLKWTRESIVIFIHECLSKLEKETESEQ